MNLAVHFSSASEHWATPKAVYAALDAEFHFDYDPCPLHSEADGLQVNWGGIEFSAILHTVLRFASFSTKRQRRRSPCF